MKKILARTGFYLIAIALLTVSVSSLGQPGKFHFPAEFEPQDAVWMSWPTQTYKVDYVKHPGPETVQIEMVRNLVSHVKVKMVVGSNAVMRQAEKALLDSNVPIDNVEFHILPYVDIWPRDWGAIYVVNDLGEKMVVDFKFNGWGLPEYLNPKETADYDNFAIIAAREQGLDTITANIVSEGGDRDFNGKGTMMAILSMYWWSPHFLSFMAPSSRAAQLAC